MCEREKRVPTAEEAACLLADIASIVERLKAFTCECDSGGDEGDESVPDHRDVLSRVTALARDQDLEIEDSPSAAILESHDVATVLSPIAEALARALAAVDNEVQTNEGMAWGLATAYYDRLAKLAKTDQALAVALKPIADFFGGQPPVRSTARA